MKLQIVTKNIELCRLEEHYDDAPHVHENWVQLTCSIRGGNAVVSQGVPGIIPEGQGQIHKPMEEHYIRVDKGNRVIVIKIRSSLWENLQQQEPECISTRQVIDPQELSDLFHEWVSPLVLVDGEEGVRQNMTETEVLQYLGRILKRESCSDKAKVYLSELPHTDEPYLNRVFEYIHDAYTSHISIEELSSLALQSRYHFIRSFKAVTGVTPYQYILRLRMQQAKYELEATDATVSAISAGLGFASASQFYRSFVKFVGMTPEQYRLNRKRPTIPV
ncbi:helix-turn-helix transcriptional regulator [Paenibacillus sp. HN-1]|uniref:helix-turn-helix domain-containing protein n=1 Tax=Paenibacillus TaxID=44249 RepID=UPI001CA82006|nr:MULTISPECIES: AraC family transcriptional regulator [Paenibacillus]MBY9078526.1 helix-turn-helix transcriptional regulator [Paenibacillus sp. CGMCC 1.18879]MBY9082819.1 helix-turn-helix transcriptional regulator [Paenibacillus sinensis]